MSAIETAMEKLTSQIGTEIGVSNWITVDQAMINAFADVTHDQQWIHVDPERAAKETPFGGAIAHGFLSLSLASRFAYDCFEAEPGQVMSINYGFNKLRFLKSGQGRVAPAWPVHREFRRSAQPDPDFARNRPDDRDRGQ